MNEQWDFAVTVLQHLNRAAGIAVAFGMTNQMRNYTTGQRVLGSIFGGALLAPLVGLMGWLCGGAEEAFGGYVVAVYLAMLIGAISPEGGLIKFKKPGA